MTLSPPTIQSVTCDASPSGRSSGFTIAWLADQDPLITGYYAELLANGAKVAGALFQKSPATFAKQFDFGIVYTARVRSVGAGVMGPWSAEAASRYRNSAMLTYDACGRLASIARVNNTTTRFTFDAFGNLQTVSDNTAPADS